MVVKDKGVVSIKDLVVGDSVLSDDKGTYTKFYSKGHYNENVSTDFLRIYTESSAKPLELTREHMVFTASDKLPVPAYSIKVGDVLRSSEGASKVTFVREISRKGLFNPYTMSGSIVVDGVVASTHLELPGFQGQDAGWVYFGRFKIVNWHSLTHFGLAPHRVICGKFMTCTEELTEDGFAPFPHYLNTLRAKAEEKQSVVFAMAVLSFVGAQSILFSVLELVLEHFMMVGLLGLGVISGGWAFAQKAKGSMKAKVM